MNDPDDWVKHSRPVHRVELDAFYMDVNEVTVGQFKQFVVESGYGYDRWNNVARYSPGDDYPMIYVSWNGATAYCEWVGKRLPTEAEWEYAARGGLIGKRYPWGDEISHDDANYIGTGGKDKWDSSTAPVGSFEPNGYGLYDMAGNVWEWCSDWYAEDYYSSSPLRNPQGSSSGSYRVLRGGSWSLNPFGLRAAFRFNYFPSSTNLSYGFRCVSGF
jgi:formylglycine-generating enzyme required for sulfatase activity